MTWDRVPAANWLPLSDSCLSEENEQQPSCVEERDDEVNMVSVQAVSDATLWSRLANGYF